MWDIKKQFFHEISFVNNITLRFAAFVHFLRPYCIEGFQSDIESEPLYHVQKAITLQLSFMTTVNQTKKKKDGVNNAMKQNRPLKMDARIEMRTKGIKSNKIII